MIWVNIQNHRNGFMHAEHCFPAPLVYLWCDTLSHTLNFIINTISKGLSSDWNISPDLPNRMQGCSTIPTDIVITSQKPDLVLHNKLSKHVIILELSVPFERNIEDTHKRKVDRYQFLISDIRNLGYTVRYHAIEIGSRGHISTENSNRIKDFLHRLKCTAKLSCVKQSLSKISLVSSYVIFHSKTESGWNEPSYVNI